MAILNIEKFSNTYSVGSVKTEEERLKVQVLFKKFRFNTKIIRLKTDFRIICIFLLTEIDLHFLFQYGKLYFVRAGCTALC
jgi:hypothetical protein